MNLRMGRFGTGCGRWTRIEWLGQLCCVGDVYLLAGLGIQQNPSQFNHLRRVLRDIYTMFITGGCNVDHNVAIQLGGRCCHSRHCCVVDHGAAGESPGWRRERDCLCKECRRQLNTTGIGVVMKRRRNPGGKEERRERGRGKREKSPPKGGVSSKRKVSGSTGDYLLLYSFLSCLFTRRRDSLFNLLTSIVILKKRKKKKKIHTHTHFLICVVIPLVHSLLNTYPLTLHHGFSVSPYPGPDPCFPT